MDDKPKPRLFTDADVERAARKFCCQHECAARRKVDGEVRFCFLSGIDKKRAEGALEAGLSPEARRVLELAAEITDFRTTSLRDQLQLQVAILDYARSLQMERSDG